MDRRIRITADELLSGAGGNTAAKTEQAEKLILDLLAVQEKATAGSFSRKTSSKCTAEWISGNAVRSA